VYRVRVIDVLISPAIGTPAPKIMLLSFRFSGVLSSRKGHSQSRESAQVTRIGADHLACKPILAVVPPCAAECRFVRVTGVLIFTNARTCVAFMLLSVAPISHRASVRN
jgi:hypothetical protein